MFFSKKSISVMGIFALFVSFAFVSSAYAADRFLTLPLEGDLRMWQGWHYGGGSDHEAIDYACDIGTPVYAAAPGIAMQSTQNPDGFGYGNFVFILHDNGYATLYSHLDAGATHIPYYPQEQQANTYYNEWVQVDRGELIGYCGNTGTSASHLHFEVSETGLYARGRVDPYDLYGEADLYPVNGDAGEMGSGHLWLNDPPRFFDDPAQEEEVVVIEPPEEVIEEVRVPDSGRDVYLTQSFFRHISNPYHVGNKSTGQLYTLCGSEATRTMSEDESGPGAWVRGGSQQYRYCEL